MSAHHRIGTDVAPARGLARVITLPAPSPGFIGDGHTAIHVIESQDFSDNDPFILLADDRIDLPRGQPAGGPHPHAGFEIVTFVVEGTLRDRDEGLLHAGDVVWTTTGSGLVHSEDVEPLGRTRILQLWVTSPSTLRWVEPRFRHLSRDRVPVRRHPGSEARVYSGTSGSIDAGRHLNLPLTMVDVALEPHAAFDQVIPADHSAFLYPLEGDLIADGLSPQRLAVGQIGWVEDGDGASANALRVTAGASGARVVLFTGQRQGVAIVTHGPFVGESRADLIRLGLAYSGGSMPRISELPSAR